MAHPRRYRIPKHHGSCAWTWRWRLAAPPRMRRRNGEKLSLFRREPPLPSEAAEAAAWELPEIAALPEPFAPTGTEAHLGA